MPETLSCLFMLRFVFSDPTYEVATAAAGSFFDSHDRPALVPITGYTVTGLQADGSEWDAITCVETVATNAVVACTYTPVGGTRSIEWSAVDGASSYVIEREINGLEWSEIAISAVPLVQHEDTQPASGDVTGYRISTVSNGSASLSTECALVEPGGPAECVTIQAGIPVIEPGFRFGTDGPSEFGPSDAIWPVEAPQAQAGSNILYGYMWIPDGWAVTSSGYYEMTVDEPGSFYSAFQLNGNGTGGIEGFSQGKVLDVGGETFGFSPAHKCQACLERQ